MINLREELVELEAPAPRKLTNGERFLISDSANHWLIQLSDIVSLEVDGNYTKVTTASGARRIIRKRLHECAQRLPGEEFCQTSRDMIVNLAHVKDIQIQDRHRLFFQMDNNQVIVLSRKQTKAFRRNFSF